MPQFGTVVVHRVIKNISYDAKIYRSNIRDFLGGNPNSVQKLQEIGKYLYNSYFLMHQCNTSLKGW